MLDYKSSPLKIAARFLLSLLLVRYVAGLFDGWIQDFRLYLLSLLPSLHLLHVLLTKFLVPSGHSLCHPGSFLDALLRPLIRIGAGDDCLLL